MEKNNDYIKELFDRDGIKAPESLSEENILKMLEAADTGADVTEEKEFKKADIKKKRPSMFRLASAAAALLVLIAGIGGYSAFMRKAPDTSLVDGELFSFENEQQIKRLVNSLDAAPRYNDSIVYDSTGDTAVRENDASVTELAQEATGSSSDTAQPKSSADSSHSSTYLQVDDVDEADIVKTDGKYIYCVNNKGEVVILSADKGKTERLSTIGSSGIENYVKDIYIKGDTLITVGQFYRDDSDTALSGIVVYDISDRSHPEYVSDFSQSGSVVSTRLTGDCVYIVTCKYVFKGDEVLPVCGKSDDFRSVPLNDICCVPEPQEPSYLILSAVDISSGHQGKAATKAIFGSGSEIYCNDHNLYVASHEYSSEADTAYTRIVRASLDGTKVKFDATAAVRGSVYGQFAMDERDGYFRIATTSQRAGMDVNNLYVLDKDLKESGKVSGFARNESIKSVRFIGPKAYVITYEAIDPLFIIDLADPEDPRIEGEVKIDGFSTLLIPVSDGRLLGIGHATGDNGYGGEFDSGLKLALFDISDPSSPKVLDSREFENMYSPAQSDHHALTVIPDQDSFAIPYEQYHETATEEIVDDAEAADDTAPAEEINDDDVYIPPQYENGVLVFRAGDSIGGIDQHQLESGYINRAVYIDDYIYALDDDGNAVSFRL